MFLDRNIFVLVLIAYVKGVPENENSEDVIDQQEPSGAKKLSDSSNFLHEVHVVTKPDYHGDFETLVGCIIEEGKKVVVPWFHDPDVTVPHLRIQYKDPSGHDAYVDIERYQKSTRSAVFVLQPAKEIPMSEYAKEATLMDDLYNYSDGIQGRVGAVNHVNGEITMYGWNHRSKFLETRHEPDGKWNLFVTHDKIDLLRGSTFMVHSPNYKNPVVVAMYYRYIPPEYVDGIGTMGFYVVDKFVLPN